MLPATPQKSTASRPRLLFVAPNFLFPADAGGKIRTTDILRGMKGKRFDITLASPAPDHHQDFAREISEICDRFVSWPQAPRDFRFAMRRVGFAFSSLPIPVASDDSLAGKRVLARELASRPDLLVIDFPHTAILAPTRFGVPSVLFTHNVETEIFRRHAERASSWVMRAVWRDQARKMEAFERAIIPRFDAVIAVSERDAVALKEMGATTPIYTIPTGIDLRRFAYRTPPERPSTPPTLVFTGSMDWPANVDAIEYFRAAIWPKIVSAVPNAQFVVVGKNPPRRLVELARKSNLAWKFTGFVEDPRPIIQDSDVTVIPMRVAGGTRLKVYEAMALGSPVISTRIGVEGLPLVPNQQCLIADDPAEFAAAAVRLLGDLELRRRLAKGAFDFVSSNFSADRVADRFSEICESVVMPHKCPDAVRGIEQAKSSPPKGGKRQRRIGMNIGKISAEFRGNLKQFGARATVRWFALKTLHHFVRSEYLTVMTLESVAPERLKLDPRFQAGFVKAEQLFRFIGSPGWSEPDYGLDREGVIRAERAGIEWYAITDGPDKLASLSKYAPVPALDGNMATFFSSDWVYTFGGFTHPDYRGFRLHGINKARALIEYQKRGKKGLIVVVDGRNFNSLRSWSRLGGKRIGASWILKLFGKNRMWNTPGCRRCGFYITPPEQLASTTAQGNARASNAMREVSGS